MEIGWKRTVRILLEFKYDDKWFFDVDEMIRTKQIKYNSGYSNYEIDDYSVLLKECEEWKCQ